MSMIVIKNVLHIDKQKIRIELENYICISHKSKRVSEGNTFHCKSYFDEITNSVVMKCLDGNVNYYNHHLLTSVHHNHDIKNILSGKSAKAAMFYITDYITKNDEKLHQVLALLSQAVAATPIATDNTYVIQGPC